jgi:diguanylate cyclase (GGDEF)-like protein
LLDDRLQQAVALAARQGTRIAVMFLDLDRFKNINDSLGHFVGDRMLEQVAARLAAALRGGDTVARLGGDEFVVLLPGLKSPADAATVAAHLLQRLAPPVLIDGRELHVTASVGISLYPDDGDCAEALMRSADTAMYHAKDSGRNGFQFYAATMKAAANLRLDVETELRAALKRGELELHYQPIYSVATQALTGLEALVRWRHPRGELLMPGDFVPLAEETGLVQEIGRWALAEACAQVRQWQAQGLPVVPVAVNLSARQFRERDFAESVRRVLERTGLDPGMLELEVTEGALMQHSAETKSALQALAALGVKISIDDFGVGYSNLVYLKRFAIDRIKIDQSFVRDIPAGGDDAAIAATIISMARTLRLHVVAEGVENGMQLAFLAAHGCDEVQGTYLCPPLPATESARIFAPAAR